MTKPFDSVIFDLDGTLWDASAAITHAFQTAKSSVDYIDNDVTLAQVQAVTGFSFTSSLDTARLGVPMEDLSVMLMADLERNPAADPALERDRLQMAV